jgi:hypothetical protein
MSSSACRGLSSGADWGKRKGGDDGQSGSGNALGAKKGRDER